LNGLGALATGLVSIVQVVTKFTTGAWIVVLIIPLIILVLTTIHRHYVSFLEAIRYTGQAPLMFLHHTVVVPVNAITKATAGALVYAIAISEDVRAVYVEVDPRATDAFAAEWAAWDIGVDLVVLGSPYRSVIRPIVEYTRGLSRRGESDLVSVVVPEVIPRKWWEHLLHNKTALYIRTAFLFQANVVVINVPFLLGRAYRLRDLLAHDDTLDEASEAEAGDARPAIPLPVRVVRAAE
jgi:hypothetical protein